MPSLYIIAGCNGAGKTTASFTVLPELLNVKEFLNADEIARGLSPFQPEKVAIEAGKIMLRRLEELIKQGVDFAFETTLASRIFTEYMQKAKEAGYEVSLLFYWLDSTELAHERVMARVAGGGHNIPLETIKRRYISGLSNFMKLYRENVDYWIVFDNSLEIPEAIAQGNKEELIIIFNNEKWNRIKDIVEN